MSAVIFAAVLAVAVALFFNFTNGFNDSASQVATIIFSRSLEPMMALLIASTANFFGAYFLGTAVAQTIGAGIVSANAMPHGIPGILVVFAALIGAILWNLITWYFGIPSSSSHALIGGLVGAFLFGFGPSPVHWGKVAEIVAIMMATPIIGFMATYFFTHVTLGFSRWFSPKINGVFKKLQIISLITQALSHGTNDGQKTMGVIVFSLIILGLHPGMSAGTLIVPAWVIVSCALSMSLGTLFGGKKIIKKLGSGLYKVRPIHGFASQTVSTFVIYCSSVFGFPVSTTQIISSSVMGAGAAFRPKMVRWQIAQNMVLVWFVTIPFSGFIAGMAFLLLNKIF